MRHYICWKCSVAGLTPKSPRVYDVTMFLENYLRAVQLVLANRSTVVRRAIICCVLLKVGFGFAAGLPYRDPALPVEARVQDLIGRMDVFEKAAQLSSGRGFTAYAVTNGQVVVSDELKRGYAELPGYGLFAFFRADWYSKRNWSNGLTPELLAKAHNAIQRYAVEKTRLGIPLLFNGTTHGPQVLGGIVLPSGLGQASSWDPACVRRGAEVSRAEFASFARAGHLAGPSQDLAADPRWCRCEESFGEDPWLSAALTRAFCEGTLAADAPRYTPQLRHLVGHGLGEGAHMCQSVHRSTVELFNEHLLPFEAGVEAGARHVMTCYNVVDGIPGCLRGDLVNGFLRERLGYRGLVFSDAGAIGSIVWQGFAVDLGEAVARAIEAGNDICCWEKEAYLAGITNALARGILGMPSVDRAVAHVLRDKFERGLFEQPYVADEAAPARTLSCPAHRTVARDMARASLTLLENRGLLPFGGGIRRLALIGPNADNVSNQIGDYTAPQRPGDVVTLRDGLERLCRSRGVELDYAYGCGIRSKRRDGFDEAVAVAGKADAIVLALGGSSVPNRSIAYTDGGTAVAGDEDADVLEKDSGEGFDRSGLRLGGVQLELLRELKKTGRPIVVVLVMGRPMVLTEVAQLADAVLLAWYPGAEGGTAVAEALFGEVNPGGRLPVSFPRSEGQLPVAYARYRPVEDYVDGPGTPQYAFGYGLGYTTFRMSDAVVTNGTAVVRVTNTGSRKGDDVVQLYLHDDVVTTSRPYWMLKGFRRITLQPGETRSVAFPLGERELGYYDRALKFGVERGTFRILLTDRAAPLTDRPRVEDGLELRYAY